jgi:hypothetical protein
MNVKSDRISEWRKRFKQRIVEAFASECTICGYNKCNQALALHHLDPTEKEFTIAQITASPKSWETVCIELTKCILVCHNCHTEIHYDSLDLDRYTIQKFDPSLIKVNDGDKYDYRTTKKTLIPSNKLVDECPVCGKEKSILNKTCSLECSAKVRYKVDWDSIDLANEIKHKSYCQIGRELGCSDSAVRKRAVKMGLI